eukprot:NODE_9573_length_1413_cov_17.197512.p1 GENE.NODE_9573_length_1413_cov_17.197512~~NODE_9573_length_1413_cov_17.197512.p1  ORF type:complete len:371 (-),score=95.99 NODE_9573_length_1413_cov_17.197512:128-1240(-)
MFEFDELDEVFPVEPQVPEVEKQPPKPVVNWRPKSDAALYDFGTLNDTEPPKSRRNPADELDDVPVVQPPLSPEEREFNIMMQQIAEQEIAAAEAAAIIAAAEEQERQEAADEAAAIIAAAQADPDDEIAALIQSVEAEDLQLAKKDITVTLRINKEEVSMNLDREDMTPYDIIKVWESWSLPYVSRVSFIDVTGGRPHKLQHRTAAVPLHPSVVKLEGNGSILTALALALKQRLPGAAPVPVWDEEAARRAEVIRIEERTRYEEERRHREHRLIQGSGGGEANYPRIWDMVRAEEAGIDTGRRCNTQQSPLRINPGKVGPPMAPRNRPGSAAARMAELPPEVQSILSESNVRGEFVPAGARHQSAQPRP